MQRFRTFIHQKRFFQKERPSSSHYSPASSSPSGKNDEDWTGTIDHRLVEDHRLKWQKRFDLFVYLLAAAIVLYAVYEWWAR